MVTHAFNSRCSLDSLLPVYSDRCAAGELQLDSGASRRSVGVGHLRACFNLDPSATRPPLVQCQLSAGSIALHRIMSSSSESRGRSLAPACAQPAHRSTSHSPLARELLQQTNQNEPPSQPFLSSHRSRNRSPSPAVSLSARSSRSNSPGFVAPGGLGTRRNLSPAVSRGSESIFSFDMSTGAASTAASSVWSNDSAASSNSRRARHTAGARGYSAAPSVADIFYVLEDEDASSSINAGSAQGAVRNGRSGGGRGAVFLLPPYEPPQALKAEVGVKVAEGKPRGLKKWRMSLTDALSSLVHSARVISDLKFERHQHFSAAVLAPEEWFEDNLLRDSEPHEFALFGAAEDKFDPAEDEAGQDKWTATKRKGPKRAQGPEMPSPLKEKRGASTAGDDPYRCLKAASKLLTVYPLPRTIEHVESLLLQHQGLIDSIAQNEHALRQPVPRAQASAQDDDDAAELAEVEAAIKNEELELLAIKQMYADKKAHSQAANARVAPPTATSAASSSAPAPAQPRAPAAAAGPSNMRSAILEKKRAMMAQQQRPSVAASPLKKRPAAAATPSSAATPRALPPRISFGAASSPKSLPGTPVHAATPKAKAPTPGSAQTTPTAQVAKARVASPKTKRPQGVQQDDLEMVTGRIWAGLGDALRPWARKTLAKQGKQAPAPLNALPFEQTYATLATILSTTPSASTEPSSPGSVASSFATLATTTDADNPDAEPIAPTPGSLVEYQLLNLLLSTLSGQDAVPSLVALSADPPLPKLSITLRDPVLPSSLPGPTGSPRTELGRKDPMVSMTALKAHLSRYAKARGWQEELATTAIYGLVSKTVLRIDRRGREGPMLGFKA